MSSLINILKDALPTQNERILEARQQRLSKLLKIPDIDTNERKTAQKARARSEDQRQTEKKEPKTLDEICHLVTELATDHKVRVHQMYTKVSKNNKNLSSDTASISDETRAVLLARKNDSSPSIKSKVSIPSSKKRSALQQPELTGKNPTMTYSALPAENLDQALGTRKLFQRAKLEHKATILPTKLTSESFEIEQVIIILSRASVCLMLLI